MSTLTRIWFLLLAFLCSVALLAMTFNIWPGIPVRNNIMQLLPALRDDAVLLQALEKSNQAMSRKLLILVGNSDREKTSAATQHVIDSLHANPFFATPVTGMNADQVRAIGQFYYGWRQMLLSDAQRRLLQNGNTDALQKSLLQTVYSPVSGINADVLAGDPLLTFYHFMRDLPVAEGHVQTVDGQLFVHGGDRDYRVILVDIREDVFDMAFHPRYQQWRDSLQQDLQTESPGTQVLLMGAVQHAVWGASSAKREVSTIGNGSLLGVIALTLLVFRTVRTLLASLLPLGAGVIAGLVCTLCYAGEIHIITLIFGCSVIGVAMDYSLHYLSEHYKTSGDAGATPQQTLQRVFPGITFAMITSAIAYGAIGFAPFPVLRQIAIFSSAGLVTAWLSVVVLYPHIVPAQSFRSPFWLRFSGIIDANLRQIFDWRHSKLLVMLWVVAMAPGIFSLHANDDIHLLQAPEPGILATEKQVQSLTGFQPNGRFFLVEGETVQQVLERTERLGDWLATQHIGSDLLTHVVPSQQRQRENYGLLRSLFFDAAPQTFASRWQSTLGLAPAAIARAQSQLESTPLHWLTPDDLNRTPLQSAVQRFQLHNTPRGFIAAAFVRGEVESAPMQQWATAQPGIHWMDPVADISALFKHYREQASWTMVYAYSLIALLLLWRYGWRAALHVLLAPALAAWITLGCLGYAGVALNLFHVLALLLVLGVGIDYSIFFAESADHRDSTMLAVILSTITTLLSFGLLSLSQTAAISSFGIVVSIGMVCALFFSPLARHHSHRHPA
jgi:predicted exporter